MLSTVLLAIQLYRAAARVGYVLYRVLVIARHVYMQMPHTGCSHPFSR